MGIEFTLTFGFLIILKTLRYGTVRKTALSLAIGPNDYRLVFYWLIESSGIDVGRTLRERSFFRSVGVKSLPFSG